MKSPNNEVDRIFPPSKNWILWCTCHFLRQSLGRSYGKPESEPHGEIAQTLEKLAKKRPYWASHSHTDKSTADSILWSNTFFWGGGGGGGSCICFHFLSCPCYFLLFVLLLLLMLFFVHCFFLLLLFASSKEKEEKKRNGINMRKEESNKRKTKTKKKRKSRKMKDKNKDTQQRMKNKGGMNKSILCQQRGYFLFCCPKLVLKNRV